MILRVQKALCMADVWQEHLCENKKSHLEVAVIVLLAGVAGLEPTLTVLETVALPLNYTPKRLCKTLFN